jgi:hypothetical protein
MLLPPSHSKPNAYNTIHIVEISSWHNTMIKNTIFLDVMTYSNADRHQRFSEILTGLPTLLHDVIFHKLLLIQHLKLRISELKKDLPHVVDVSSKLQAILFWHSYILISKCVPLELHTKGRMAGLLWFVWLNDPRRKEEWYSQCAALHAQNCFVWSTKCSKVPIVNGYDSYFNQLLAILTCIYSKPFIFLYLCKHKCCLIHVVLYLYTLSLWLAEAPWKCPMMAEAGMILK